jgi:ABC-type Mn2+/Zn2+ transport system ATPase subunit
METETQDKAPPPAVETEALAVAPEDAPRPVVEGVAMRVPRGARAVLAGANGAGKSTLLKTLAGLLPPLAGRALLDGKPAARGNPDVAFLAQRSLVEWNFPVTVRQAVLAGRNARLGWLRRPSAGDREKAALAMRLLGLEPLASRPLHALSGGQRQRVLLARALCQEARILLLDEPFAGLDAASRDILGAFLADAPKHALTVLMATHDAEGEGPGFDLFFKIRDGRLETLPRAAF